MEILVILLALIPLALLVGGLAWFAYTGWTGRHVAFRRRSSLPLLGRMPPDLSKPA